MKIIFISLILITILSTGITHASTFGSKTGDDIIENIKTNMSAIQKQIDDLKTLNGELKAQINNIKNLQPQIETVSDLQSQITNTDIKVQAVETRIGVIEKAVDYLQTKVMSALDTVIGLLKQLLK
jgi:chromosome segregation ATPase